MKKAITLVLLLSVTSLGSGGSNAESSGSKSSTPAFYTIQQPMASIVANVWKKSGFTGINIPQETATGTSIEITHINMVDVCNLNSKPDVELAMKLFSTEASIKMVRGPYGVYERGNDGIMKFSSLNPSAETSQSLKPVCKSITVTM